MIGQKDNSYFVLLIRDKKNEWTFPKGLIEPEEKPERTAAREIQEETGLKTMRLVTPLSPVSYFYTWKERKVYKTVSYFLFEGDMAEALTPQTEEGITEVKWVSLVQAKEIIGYKKTNSKILDALRLPE